MELIIGLALAAVVYAWPKGTPLERYWARRARLDRRFEKATGRRAPGAMPKVRR